MTIVLHMSFTFLQDNETYDVENTENVSSDIFSSMFPVHVSINDNQGLDTSFNSPI